MVNELYRKKKKFYWHERYINLIYFQQIDDFFFWSPTKTINFFRCLWLIDKNQLYFCPNIQVFIQYNPRFLLVVTNKHLLTVTAKCTVHVYDVIHFCDSMWYFWVEVNLCPFHIVCLYLYSRWRSNLLSRGGFYLSTK